MGNTDNQDMELPTVTLIDASQRTLECYVEGVYELGDREFAALLPVDTPVVIVSWQEVDDEDEEAVDIQESGEFEHIFPIAQSVLAQQNLTLKHTSLGLTVEGDVPDVDDRPLEMLFNDDDEPEEPAQLLTSFFSDDKEFNVLVPLNPMLIVARLEGTHAYLLTPEEEEEIQPLLPVIEQALVDQALGDL